MAGAPNPFEIARETLLQLAQKRIPPTPDNYRMVYAEIAGAGAGDTAPAPEILRQIARLFPRDTPERMRLGHALEHALDNGGEGRKAALEAFLGAYRWVEPPAWNELIGSLLQEWERRQMEWTTARKRQALERVLAANDPSTLYTRLRGLVRAWTQQDADPDCGAPVPVGLAPVAATALVAGPAPEAPPPEVQLLGSGESQEMLQQFKTLLIQTLDEVVGASLGEHPSLHEDAASLGADARQARNTRDLARLGKRLHKFAIRLELAAGDVGEIRSGLLSLLRLLLENIDQLVLDDRWLHGQVEAIREIVDKPATLQIVDAAERRLKDLIIHQGRLKASLIAAQDELKRLLGAFLGQLAQFDASTGDYSQQLQTCSARLSAVTSLTELGPVLSEVMHATQDMQRRADASRDELDAARHRASLAEERLHDLQHELEQASHNMRHDPLTGILNRRGLTEALTKEIGRAQRRHRTLCLALIDLDNFKKLNDQHGHSTGDQALRTLAEVMQRSLRPQDTAGRLGGEEFVVALPETELDDAVVVLTRLQRELTKAFFLAGNQKLLITFSAGVTPVAAGENTDLALKRADQAMYLAKQAGKNRVHALPAPAGHP